MKTTIAVLSCLLAVTLAACGGSDVDCHEEGEDTVCNVTQGATDRNRSCEGCHVAPTEAPTAIELSLGFESYRHRLPQHHPVLMIRRAEDGR
jgi:hypothetical protein